MLPDFECDGYRSQLPTWRYLSHLYQGSTAWIEYLPDGSIRPTKLSQRYLPQFLKEHDKDYAARLARSPYVDRFATAIRDFVGLIFHQGLDWSDGELPPYLDNLDNRGNSAIVVFSRLAIEAMKSGHTFALVTAAGGRPYVVPIAVEQVKDWATAIRDGVEVLERCTVEFRHSSGQISYLVLSPGRYDYYTIAESKDSSGQVQRTAVYHADRSGQFGVTRSGVLEPFDFIPLVCLYGGTQTGFFRSLPPLKSLADLNLAHYQLYSDHLNKIRLCCFPVPVRAGTMGDQDELVLSPSVTVDLPPGGSFFWAEPNAGSIELSRREIEAIESAMDFLGLQYLVKPSDRQAAMVSMVQAAKVESSLELFVRSFVQGLNQVVAIYCRYLGLLPSQLGLNTKFHLDQTADPALLQAYVQVVQALANLPDDLRLYLLDLLRSRGFLDL